MARNQPQRKPLTDAEVIRWIRGILWGTEKGLDINKEWTPDTIESIANFLIDEGRGP